MFLTFLLSLYIKILFYKRCFSKIPFLESRIHFLACDFFEFGKEMIFGLLVETDLKWKITNSVLDFSTFSVFHENAKPRQKPNRPKQRNSLSTRSNIMRFVNNPT